MRNSPSGTTLGRARPAARIRTNVIASVQQAPSSRVYRVKDSNRFPNANESSWRGYVGTWHVDLQDPAAYHTLTGLRTWRWRDAERTVLGQTNVYSIARPGTTVRQADGLHQKDFVYEGDMFAPERQEEPLSMTHGSALAVDACASGRLGSFRLPDWAAPAGPAGTAATAAAGGTAGAAGGAKSGPWGMEVFLQDGDCRWGLVLLYAAGALSKITFTQEFDTTADPSTPHVLDSPDCTRQRRPPRPQLPWADPAGWVTHGSVCRRVTRVRAAPASGIGGNKIALLQGELLQHQQEQQVLMLEEGLQEAVSWEPPSGTARSPAEAAGHSELLIPLPDAMYVRAPATLAPKQATGSSGGADRGGDGAACVFEFGGLLRYRPGGGPEGFGGNGGDTGGGETWPGLQRLVIRYEVGSGQFLDASRDVFVPGV